MSEPIALRVEGLSVRYGRASTALQDVTMEVRAGEIVSLLGANGAGKTTLARAVVGSLDFYGGRVTSGTILGTAREAGRGLVQVPEGRRILGQLSVEDNLRAGAVAAGKGRFDEDAIATVWEYFPVLRDRRSQLAGYLSGGEQQMLAIGRALVADPSFLILDEPMLGLAPKIIDQVAQIVARLRDDAGLTILLIEQNASVALGLADRGYALHRGRIVAEGTADELRQSEALSFSYLGGAHGWEADEAEEAEVAAGSASGRGASRAGERLLTVSDLRLTFGSVAALSDVSIHVDEGELVGLIGPNGAGKSSLINCITGVYRGVGRVRWREEDVPVMTPSLAARLGIGRTFQNVIGLQEQSVLSLVLLGRERQFRRGLLAALARRNRTEEREQEAVCRQLLEEVGIAEYADELLADCPYGVQKRADLARALACEPQLLLLDEPFAGLNEAEAQELLAVVTQLAERRGVGVMLVDHDVATLFAGMTRVVVMDAGRVIADGPAQEVRHDPLVQEAYLGTAATAG